MNDRLLTTEDLAARLRVSRRTLEAWRLRGGGPRFVRTGGAVRYRESDVAQWIAASVRESTSAAGPPQGAA